MAQPPEDSAQGDAVKTETDQTVDQPQTIQTAKEPETVLTTRQPAAYGFTNPHPLIRVYISLVLPLVCVFLRSDWINNGGWTQRPYLYCLTSLVLMALLVWGVCHRCCAKKTASHASFWNFVATVEGESGPFFWKVFAAVLAPAILIGSDVIAPLFLFQERPLDVYTGYLIGRLCLLIVVSVLLCIGNTNEAEIYQYEEGLHQLRMTWSAFVLLFASDLLITRVAEPTNLTSKQMILALVSLNFCGGITLLGLPLWKLNHLRKLIPKTKQESPTTMLAS